MEERVGITALVPPELVYACGCIPVDLNNYVPTCGLSPPAKLCAWTASWRSLVIQGQVELDRLVVVAGGDCPNALVDGQKLEMHGVPTHYFFYPFHEERGRMVEEMERLAAFLGGVEDSDVMSKVTGLKGQALALEEKRKDRAIPPEEAFSLLVSASDLGGSLDGYAAGIEELASKAQMDGAISSVPRIAMLGVPPIQPDFHKKTREAGLYIAFDEMPHEFVRLSGSSMEELAASYSEYTFARELMYRIERLSRELDLCHVEAAIHYTQYACHHTLEDDLLRRELGIPILTVQGDLPRPVDQQLLLRMEAFGEILGRR